MSSERVRAQIKRILPPIAVDAGRRVLRRARGDEWVYLSDGWPDSSAGTAWNDASVISTQRRAWPLFLESVQAPGILGGSPEGRDGLVANVDRQNTILVFAYVLALTAVGKSRISLLDWGGGLGQYSVLAKALVPDVAVDYHCRDLPLANAAGRQLIPDGQFHDTDEDALRRPYDLVVASSSLQYSRDWKSTLRDLARVANRRLLVTRQPFVQRASSFVVLQRPWRHGYHTEYPAWFLNRTEFLDFAHSSALRLRREFLIAEKPWVPRAPEQAQYLAFLFDAEGHTRDG